MTNNEIKYIDRIKTMLGGDVLKIEIPDETIYKCIQIALETIEPYIPDTRYITLPFSRCIDMSQYKIEEVLRVVPGQNLVTAYGIGDEFNFGWNINAMGGTTLAAWMNSDTYVLRQVFTTAARSTLPDQNISFEYDRTTHKLYLTPGTTLSDITIECIPEVFSIDDLQDKASVKWVYLYALALTKEIVGRIRSKAKSQNVPIQLDGDTLLQEAAQEKQKLEQALVDDALGPVGILR